jgi:hypothetical protein
MNYLVTHYKNLAEQLQSRINHIQQCLYEMDAAAGGGIDQLRVDDMPQNYMNYNNNSVVSSSSTPTPPAYPIVKPPFRTLSDIDPSRFGIEIGPNGKPKPPVPVTWEWRRAVDRYNEAVRAYQGYQRFLNKEGIYKPRKPKDRL